MKHKLLSLTLIGLCVATLSFAQTSLVITEIMYNPPESGNDTLEFVEIFNNSTSAVDLEGVYFSAGFTFTFPAGATLGANAYAVICGDADKYAAFYGVSTPYVWSGGATQLNNSGEAIAMRTAAGVLIDTVRYNISAGWPTSANGGGASLVLCDVNADNNVPTSWYASTTAVGASVNGVAVFASPGAADACLTVGVNQPTTERFSVYPNPAFEKIVLSKPADVELFDMTGQRKLSAKNVREVNVSTLPAGLYVVRTASGEMSRFVKK